MIVLNNGYSNISLQFAHKRLDAVVGLQYGSTVLQAIDFCRQEITLTYQWQKGSIKTLRGRFSVLKSARPVDLSSISGARIRLAGSRVEV